MKRELVINSATCSRTGVQASRCRCPAHNAHRDDDDTDDVTDDDTDDTDDDTDDDTECPECGGEVVDGVCQDCGAMVANGQDDDGEAASRAAAFASLRAGGSRRHAMDALQCASAGDSEGAASAHLKAAKRLRADALAAMDPNSDVGGKGVTDRNLATKMRKAAKAHEEAAAVHVQGTVGGEDDAGDDSATTNARRAENARRHGLARRRAVRNAQRRRAPVTVNAGSVGIGDVLDFDRPSMRSVVANQRRREVKNYADGGNSPYPQYDLPTSPLQRGRMMQATGCTGPSFAQDDSMPSGAAGSKPMASYPDEDDPVRQDIDTATVGTVPGIQLLEPGEQAAVDQEMARRLGLDYMPEDEYQLRTPRTMAELLARERMQGHTRNGVRNAAMRQAAVGDVMVLNSFDPREAQAFQRRLDRRR